MKRKLITKLDAIIILVLVIISVVLVVFNQFFKEDGTTAIISVDGKVVNEIDLSKANKNEQIVLDNNVVIAVENGQIFFLESNCKDKICVNTGKLSKSGDVAACVPNKTVITVKGTQDNFDVVTY